MALAASLSRRPGAGDLRERVAFDKRAVVDDGYGNPVSGNFTEQFRRAAAFYHRGGSEAVMAARLEGRSVFDVFVRSSSQTRAITTGWRMRDVRRGTVYNIDHVDAVTDRQFVYLTVESGVAP